jgi:hypothetical protein
MIRLARNLLAVARHAIRPSIGASEARPAAVHYFEGRR